MRRTLSADHIGQMHYLGQDDKTPARPNNPPKLIMDGGQQDMVPMIVPLSDFRTAPDLRPGGADVSPASEITRSSVPAVAIGPNRPVSCEHPPSDWLPPGHRVPSPAGEKRSHYHQHPSVGQATVGRLALG
jgi:hypothetical protein